jgi:hypothetical protein
MPIPGTGPIHDVISARVGTEFYGSHVQWRGKGCYCVPIGICELINCHLNRVANCINVRMKYNYVASELYLCPNAV